MGNVVGGLFGSKATPVQTSQSPTGFNTLPEFGKKAFEEGVARATTLSEDPSLFAPAGFNQDQLSSFDLARLGYQNLDPATFNEQLAMFSNPFEDQVIAGLESDINRQGRGLLSDIDSGATGAGAFGSTRQGVVEAETIRGLADVFANQAANVRSQNFQSAADRAIGNIATQNNLQSQQMQDLASIGGLQQAQATQERQAPLDAVEFLLQAAQGLPTGGGTTGSALRNNPGLFSRLGSSQKGISTALGIGSILSDKSAKENIIHVGKENGHNIYEFNYIGLPNDRFIGVMAQEVAEIHPEAVSEEDGFLRVNYDDIGVTMRRIS
jgi:hypothetical protein